MINDITSDMLTRLRNAALAKHISTSVKYSKLNLAILKIFKAENFIKNYEIKNLKVKEIRIFLSYKGWWIKRPYFSIINKISKPGQRIFSGYKNFEKLINPLKYKQGVAIISTSSGVMSHNKAIALKKGGEVLCYIE
jgi:small subunit ribosomal protein S8